MPGQMTIVLRSDPQQFEEGTDAAIKAIRDWETQTGVSADNASQKLEDAIRAVVDLGRQTGRSSEDMVRALRGIGLRAQDAEDAIAAIEAETRSLGRQGAVDIKRAEDAADDLGRAAEDAGDKTGSINDRTSDVGDGLRDLGTVVNDVLKGDFASAAGGAIEALGGIAGSLAGGAVGGAIAASVASIVGGWVTAWDEAAKASEERIGTWADKFIENQGRVLSEAQILAEIQKILQDDTEKQAQAQEIAAATGMTYAEVLRALAGDTDYLSEAHARLEGQSAAAQARIDEVIEKYGRANPEIILARDSINQLADSLAAQSKEMESGASNFDAYTEAAELGKQKTDELADSITNIPQPPDLTVKINVDDSNLRNYKPRTIYIPGQIVRPGQVAWE